MFWPRRCRPGHRLVGVVGYVSLLPQKRHRMACFLMGSAQNGQGLMDASCAVLAGSVLVSDGLAAGWTVGRSRTQIRAKIPRMSPPNTQPTTLRFLFEATIPQKIGQKTSHKMMTSSIMASLVLSFAAGLTYYLFAHSELPTYSQPSQFSIT